MVSLKQIKQQNKIENKMIATGTEIARKLVDLKEKRDRVIKTFEPGLTYEEGSERERSPQDILSEYESYDVQVYLLAQNIQARYNMAVLLDVEGQKLTLLEVIKLKGTLASVLGHWKEAADKDVERENQYSRLHRGTAEEIPKILRTISEEEATSEYDKTKRRLYLYTDAVAAGNSVKLDLEIPGLNWES